MNYPRTITIVATIPDKKDLDDAKWIWETHGEGKIKHGIKIDGIGSGNYFTLLDETEEKQFKLEETRDVCKWYNEERENKIKILEAKIQELELSKNENT